MIVGDDLPAGGGPLEHRPKAALVHIETVRQRPDALLLDTNAIGGMLTGKAPMFLRPMLATTPDIWISACGVAEVEHLAARLAPEHPDTGRVVRLLRQALAEIGSERILVPTAADWTSAGRLAGAISRRHGGAPRRATPSERIELLNDCLSAAVALRAGATVLTNDLDFDLIQQAWPEVRVAFFGHADSTE